MIVIRATKLNEEVARIGFEISKAAGLPLCYVVDGRFPVTFDMNDPVIPVLRQDMEGKGLYCPPDFAWRCGDYGLYLVRAKFPSAPFIWQIESDVRFVGMNIRDFFEFFSTRPCDFLGAHLRPAEKDYRWYTFGSGRNVTPWRCLFPLTRFSTRALDVLKNRRIEQGYRRQRRATWPNDEVFAATTLIQMGYDCHDINGFGRSFFDEQTFNFHTPMRGEALEAAAVKPGIYHPVLFGAEYDAKVKRVADRKSPLKTLPWVEQRVRRSFNHLCRW